MAMNHLQTILESSALLAGCMQSGCMLAVAGAMVVGTAAAGAAAADEPVRIIHSQPSHVIANSQVELAVTSLGGHMSPVTFFRDTAQPVNPYYVSPWQFDPPAAMPVPVLVPLRGDFFCMPFGGNTDEVGGERHPPHGEVAGSAWQHLGTKHSGPVTSVTLALDTTVRRGRVTKELSLVEGHNIVYSKHTIEGFAGPVPLGHHATLAMPDKEGSVRISTSSIRFGMTYPGVFSDPGKGEYQRLLPGARFTNLNKVPVGWKDAPDADLSRLPGQTGFADLIQLINQPWEQTKGPAWTTATFADAGYVWFSLKDPDVLRTTVFWMENHGRHGHPWNGRNNCLGLEDVTAYFADGLAASVKDNLLTKEGIPTCLVLREDRPTTVNYIQGAVRVSAGFDIVARIEFAPGQMTLISGNGGRVTVPVRHEFLRTGSL